MAKKQKTAPETTLTKTDIIRAATNNPVLSTSQFTLGDKVYTIVDLAYDDYLAFLSMLQPLIEQLVKGVSGRRGISLNGIDISTPGISAANIIAYCSENLPKMAQIVCKATDPDITIEKIKADAKNPFKLAEVVLAQVIQNNIIKDFASFFQSVLPLLTQVMM